MIPGSHCAASLPPRSSPQLAQSDRHRSDFFRAIGRCLLSLGNGYGESVADGVLYYSSSSLGLLFARNAATGAEIWTKSMSTDPPNSKPTIANGLLYVGVNDARVIAVDVSNGVTDWFSGFSRLPTLAEVTVVNGWVYFSSMGYNVDAYHLP